MFIRIYMPSLQTEAHIPFSNDPLVTTVKLENKIRTAPYLNENVKFSRLYYKSSGPYLLWCSKLTSASAMLSLLRVRK
jgi:hypothetical protein